MAEYNKLESKQDVNKEELGFFRKNKKMIAGILFFVIILVGLSLLIFSRQLFGDEVGNYILGNGVANGFVYIGNFFKNKMDAIFGTLLVIFILFVVYYAIYIPIKLLGNKTPRKKTISSIVLSLFKYLLVVIGIISVLAIWGVNIGGIFASVGIVGLIVGIGCKSIVNDIVSGFFIVVDNYYQVGDRIKVDGFEGDVIDIGLRTTKIEMLGETKSICNSLINTVVNVTKDSNPIKCYVDISFNEDLRRAEAIFAKCLPDIQTRIPTLTSPIIYRGVTNLDECGVELEFYSSALLADKYQARKLLLRELYLMFIDNDIIPAFNKLPLVPNDYVPEVKKPVARAKKTKIEK